MFKIKKLSAILFAAVLSISSMSVSGLSMTAHAEDSDTKHQIDTDDLSITTVVDGKEGVVPTFKYGESQKLTFRLKNKTFEAYEHIKVSIDLQGDTPDNWPFTTKKQSYEKEIDVLGPNETVDVSWKFKEKAGVQAQRYTIYLNVRVACDEAHCRDFDYEHPSLLNKDSAVYKIFVNTTASSSNNRSGGGSASGGGRVSGGGDDGGGGSYSNEGGEGDGSTPRIIVTGFTTVPENVQAGEKFTLTVHVKNTSKKQKVGNLLFNFNGGEVGGDEEAASGAAAPSFLPTSGTSEVYLESIGANKSADVTIEMTADRNLSQAPYSMDIGISYENANHESLDSSSSLTIPVKQKARYEFSQMELTPEAIAVGDQANLTGTVNNMGRTTLHNVKVYFEGKNIESEATYMGNIGSGSSASIDAMLTGLDVTDGPQTIQMIFSYEDSEGKVIKDKQQFTIEVTDEMNMDFSDMDDMGEEENSSFPIVPILIGLVLLAAAAGAGIFILKKKMKKGKMGGDDDFADEFDDDPEMIDLDGEDE